MTVSSTTTRNSYSGNGSTTTFAYGFKIFADADLTVILRASTGAETVQTLTTHYTVSNAGNASGGNVVFGSAPASGVTVVIRRNMGITQATDYVANDPFPAATHEDALDRLTFISQQMQEEIDRSIKLSRTNTMTSTEFTTSATDRASKVLSFNASGELAVTQELGTFKGDSATTTTAAFTVRDIVKATTTAQLNNIYICVADSVIGDTLTDTDHFELLVDAVSAATSATTATTKATAAASSATAAASSASTASTQASNASTSASTASTQATNAANSATAAASSATSAATALDNFDDIFLGAKSSDPSVDNDGDSLTAGDLYFNTSSNVLKVYTGSTWSTVSTFTTGISNTNIPIFTSGVADDDFLRVAGTSIEGRSASEVLSDIGGQASLTFGISNTNIPIFTSGVADDDFLRVNGTSIEGRSASEVLSDIGASAVAGSSSIVTTGALNSGSITSGFGTIDTGSSNITSTGVGAFGSLDISGDIDVDGTTNLDAVDIDGAVDMASTLNVTGAITGTSTTLTGDITASSFNGGQIAVNNMIINGNMAINQRGATSGVTSGYFVDRFTLSGCSASAVITSSTPTQFPTAITVSATSGNPIISQKIESKNVQHLSGKVVTASFFAKNISNATTLFASLAHANSADNFGATTTIAETNLGNLTSDWVKYTASYTVPSGGLNGLSLNILCSGTSTFTMGVTGVMLQEGSVATPFEHRSFGEELALCQRYFKRLEAGSSTRISTSAFADTTTRARFVIYHNPEMRSAPTTAEVNVDLDGQDLSAIATVGSTDLSDVIITRSSGSHSTGDILQVHTSSNTATLDFDSEL